MTSTAPWYLRPARVLPLVAGVLIAAALFAPQPHDARSGDARLTTASATPQGARLLFELADRLGYAPSRSTRDSFRADPRVTYAVLDPVVALRATETAALLAHVRRGGGALVVLGEGTRALAESLAVRTPAPYDGRAVRRLDDACNTARRSRDNLWFGQTALLLPIEFATAPAAPVESLLIVGTAPRRRARVQGGDAPALVGIRYGAGRLVLASDPDLFRNDALRECALALDVAAIRALEYLRDGGARPSLVFDEYHQTTVRAGTLTAIGMFLTGTSPGHVVLQVAGAAVLVMIGAAIRVLPPIAESRLERRSPLEAVDALARAYEQARATRIVSTRLTRGLRRRLGGTAVRRTRLSDAAFLDHLGAQHPSVRHDVETLKLALTHPTRPRDVAHLAGAAHRIESALRGSSS